MRGIFVFASLAFFAGCGSGTVPGGGDPGTRSVRTDRTLLYVGDWDTNDVFVYDFSSGKQLGTLTGFDEPYGMCVDEKGDVYIANFGAGTVSEYAHGGTTPINTYNPGGEPMGCAVDKHNDLAVTSFSPGEVIVFAGGDPSRSTTYSDSSCEYLWTMAYDGKDNLYGVGEHTAITICELPAGSKTMETQPVTGFLDFPGGMAWDGKYLVLCCSNSGSKDSSELTQYTEDGGPLKKVGVVSLSDTCYKNYVDDVNPFILGKKNGFAGKRQGRYMVGPNLWCADEGKSKVDVWRYPKGGLPIRHIPHPPGAPYGAAVSLAP